MKKLVKILSYFIFFLLAVIPSYSQNFSSGLEKIYERSREYELINALPLESGGFILFGNTTAGNKGGYDIAGRINPVCNHGKAPREDPRNNFNQR